MWIKKKKKKTGTQIVSSCRFGFTQTETDHFTMKDDEMWQRKLRGEEVEK